LPSSARDGLGDLAKTGIRTTQQEVGQTSWAAPWTATYWESMSIFNL